jgi:hypothetical protein
MEGFALAQDSGKYTMVSYGFVLYSLVFDFVLL